MTLRFRCATARRVDRRVPGYQRNCRDHGWHDSDLDRLLRRRGEPRAPAINSNEAVQIVCRLQGFAVADGNTWWYQIGSDPWDGNFYASADAFYNDGATSGSS